MRGLKEHARSFLRELYLVAVLLMQVSARAQPMISPSLQAVSPKGRLLLSTEVCLGQVLSRMNFGLEENPSFEPNIVGGANVGLGNWAKDAAAEDSAQKLSATHLGYRGVRQGPRNLAEGVVQTSKTRGAADISVSAWLTGAAMCAVYVRQGCDPCAYRQAPLRLRATHY